MKNEPISPYRLEYRRLGRGGLRLFFRFQVEAVHESMKDRRYQQAEYAEEDDAAENRVKAGEDLGAGRCQQIHRPMPPTIIEAFRKASTHDRPASQ